MRTVFGIELFLVSLRSVYAAWSETRGSEEMMRYVYTIRKRH